MTTSTLAFLGSIGPMEMLVIGVLGVLIFGKRLPEVGRNLGKSFVEFKKGLANVEQEARQSTANIAQNSTPAPAAAPVQTAEVKENQA